MPLAGCLAGGEFDGAVRNLAGTGTFRGARLAFVHDGISPEQRYRYAVALDGDLVKVLQDGEFEGRIESIPPGVHRIEVLPIREDVRRIPDMHGHDYGRRAFVRWDRNTEPDVRSYRVERLIGATWTPEGTVSIVDLFARYCVAPDAGTGSGKLTLSGGWSGDAVNAEYTIEIVTEVAMTGAGELRHNLRGDWETVPFVPGVPVYLPFGVVLLLEGLPAAFDDGDTWTFFVGPRNWFASGDLEEGTHSFRVIALDAAGNESDPSDTVNVAIIYAPGDVTNIAAEMDSGDVVLSWTLPPDGDLNAVLIYSNFSLMFGTLGELVIETGAWAVLAANATGHTFTPAVPGVWRFYVRTRDTAGRLSESIELVEIDTTGIPADVELREPEQVLVTATAGGTFALSWEYPIPGDVTEFHIYRNEDPEAPEFDTPVAVVAYPALTATGLVPESASVWYTVRASDGTYETANVDLHEGVPDDEAPDAPENPLGVPN